MSFGINNGKATGYTSLPPEGLQKIALGKRFDNAHLSNFYVDPLTWPAPIKLLNR